MQIELNDGKQKVMLRGGDNAFELCEQRQQKGEATWTPVAWYADLGAALNALAKRKIRNADAKSVQELKAAVQAVRDELTAVWSVEPEAA